MSTGFHRRQFSISAVMLTMLLVGVCIAIWLRLRGDAIARSISVARPNVVQFGIAGKVDVDRDGLNDLGKLIKLIESNGGQVSFLHRTDGSVIGTLNPKLSYLVIDSVADKTVAANLSVKDAANYGIVVMELRKLLDHIERLNPKKSTAKSNPPGGNG
jgi:hypothetical protein